VEITLLRYSRSTASTYRVHSWRGRIINLKEMGDNENERSSKSWEWRGEEGAGISPRNSTLDVEEEEDKGEASESTGGETGGGE